MEERLDQRARVKNKCPSSRSPRKVSFSIINTAIIELETRWLFITYSKNLAFLLGVAPYNGLYGVATPKKGPFIRLEVYQRGQWWVEV